MKPSLRKILETEGSITSIAVAPEESDNLYIAKQKGEIIKYNLATNKLDEEPLLWLFGADYFSLDLRLMYFSWFLIIILLAIVSMSDSVNTTILWAVLGLMIAYLVLYFVDNQLRYIPITNIVLTILFYREIKQATSTGF